MLRNLCINNDEAETEAELKSEDRPWLPYADLSHWRLQYGREGIVVLLFHYGDYNRHGSEQWHD